MKWNEEKKIYQFIHSGKVEKEWLWKELPWNWKKRNSQNVIKTTKKLIFKHTPTFAHKTHDNMNTKKA